MLFPEIPNHYPTIPASPGPSGEVLAWEDQTWLTACPISEAESCWSAFLNSAMRALARLQNTYHQSSLTLHRDSQLAWVLTFGPYPKLLKYIIGAKQR